MNWLPTVQYQQGQQDEIVRLAVEQARKRYHREDLFGLLG
jgi:hypothetical protein